MQSYQPEKYILPSTKYLVFIMCLIVMDTVNMAKGKKAFLEKLHSGDHFQ